MSELCASGCGCDDRRDCGGCGNNSCIWIIILLLLCGGCGNDCGGGFGGFGGGCGNDSCIWIIILLFCCGGCGNGFC